MNWQIIIKFSPNKNSDKSFSTSSFDPRKFDSKFTARTQAFTREELTDYYQIFAKSKSRQIIQYFKLFDPRKFDGKFTPSRPDLSLYREKFVGFSSDFQRDFLAFWHRILLVLLLATFEAFANKELTDFWAIFTQTTVSYISIK